MRREECSFTCSIRAMLMILSSREIRIIRLSRTVDCKARKQVFVRILSYRRMPNHWHLGRAGDKCKCAKTVDASKLLGCLPFQQCIIWTYPLHPPLYWCRRAQVERLFYEKTTRSRRSLLLLRYCEYRGLALLRGRYSHSAFWPTHPSRGTVPHRRGPIGNWLDCRLLS